MGYKDFCNEPKYHDASVWLQIGTVQFHLKFKISIFMRVRKIAKNIY